MTRKTKCPLLPCADFVVLRPTTISKKGSLLLAPNTPTREGIVVAVGPEDETGLQEGEKVCYVKYLTEVELSGEVWLLVRG